MLRAVALVLTLVAGDARAQGLAETIESYGLTEIDPPPRENRHSADEWRAKYRANWPVHVSVESDRLVLRRWTGKETARFGQRHRAGAVEYVGTHSGEFGGGLVAVFPDGRKARLLDEPIVALVPWRGALLAASGLAHGDVSGGALRRIEKAASTPRLRLLTLLPDAPFVLLEDPAHKRLLIVGLSSLVSFGGHGPKEQLVILASGPYWPGVHPNSAALYRGRLVIGAENCLVFAELEHGEVVRTRYFQQTAPDRLRR